MSLLASTDSKRRSGQCFEREKKREWKHYFIISVCIVDCACICHIKKCDFVSFQFISFCYFFSFQHHVACLMSWDLTCSLSIFRCDLLSVVCAFFFFFFFIFLENFTSQCTCCQHTCAWFYFSIVLWLLGIKEEEEEEKDRWTMMKKTLTCTVCYYCILMYLTTKSTYEERKKNLQNQNNNKWKSFHGKSTNNDYGQTNMHITHSNRKKW